MKVLEEQHAPTRPIELISRPEAVRVSAGGRGLDDQVPALQLPTDRIRPVRPSGRAEFHGFRIAGPILTNLRDLARAEATTLFAVWLAAYQVWLYRYTGQSDIVVGTRTDDRERPEMQSSAGLARNVLPVSTQLEGNSSFRDVLRQASQNLQGAPTQEGGPFEQIVEEAGDHREARPPQPFPVMLVFLEDSPSGMDQDQGRPSRMHIGTCENDLTLTIQASRDAWECRFEYATDLFDGETVARMAGHLTELLHSIADDPEKAIAHLNLMPREERHRVLVEWNRTQTDFPRDKCVHQLFEEQVERAPDAVAVEFDGQSLTYAELNARANRLAHHLRTLGVGPDVLVGLCAVRSVEMVVALLGILKAGGAYVPIDPEYPADRLAFMIADADVPVLLTQSQLASDLPAHAASVFRLDSDWDALSHLGDAKPPDSLAASNLAYMIYTSGSTGKPKGALNTHRAIVNRLAWMQDQYRLSPADTVLQKTPFSFDVSVWEFFWPLLNGARLVVAKPGGHQDAAYLVRLIRDHGVTVVHFVPPMLGAFIEETGVDLCTSLRHVICSGEALTMDLQRRFLDRLGAAQLHNLYGPTEAAVDVTHWTCRRDSVLPFVPIGRPIANTQCYILDARLEPVPVGLPGELHLGGVQVGRGYHNRPELTSEKFIPDPFRSDPDARLYKTGDLCRFLPDGNIEFLGRLDNQVKVRGFRVELGEIEAVLSAHPRVASCAAIACDQGGADKTLAAFMVLRGQVAISVRSLREWLGERLPDYMIPSRFFTLPALPLSPNGKVDRRALNVSDGAELDIGTPYLAPRTESERTLTEIWQAALGRNRVGVRDNFFDLGGHSLLAAVIAARITQFLGVAVPFRRVFEHPTIEDLCRRMEAADGERSSAQPVEPTDRLNPLPMSFGQQRMWLLQQLLPDHATYNQPVVWRLHGGVDRVRVRRALRVILDRHEVLRTALVEADGELRQQVVAPQDLILPWGEVDLGEIPSDSRQDTLRERLWTEARRPFDLAQAPLWRALWITLADDDHVLAFTFHHCMIDDWSIRLLARELAATYRASDLDVPTGLPALPVQYADFASWQRQRLTAERRLLLANYWREQLHDAPAALELPTDRSRTSQPTGRGAIHHFRLAGPMLTALRELARVEATTLFTVCLAAFQVWLYRYTGQSDVVVGTPVAERERPEAQPLIGFFLNTLPIRSRLEGTASFRDVVRQVRQTLSGAFAHADLPFEQIVELAAKERHPERQPLFQVMFVLLEDSRSAWELDQAEVRPLMVHTGTSKSDLTLDIQAGDEAWECSFEYATDLFDGKTVARMAGHLAELLHSIVDDPEEAIDRLRLMPDEERHQILVEWNRTETDYPRDKCVHQLFEEQVERTPDAVAVLFDGRSLTYAELNRKADSVADQLRTLGVGPGDLIGFGIERSFERIIGLLGILKAGGAYWAWEDNLPDDRLARMLIDARPKVLLVRNQFADDLHALSNQFSADHPGCFGTVAAIEDLLRSDLPGPAANPPAVRANDPAYVSFTSGSTGQPKGVVVPHRGVSRLVKGADYVSLTSDDTLLHLSPLSFDASTFEIWGALLNGGRVVLPPSGQLSLGEIGEAIREHRVTTLWLTASLFHLMVDERLEDLKPLRQLLAGGDVLSVEHVLKARDALPGCRIINGYGPTENTTFTCCYPVPTDADLRGSVPIGRPIANTRVYVLDARREPVPVGVTGELYAGGDGVATGYLNQPRLTAERFFADWFRPGEDARLYRTGDSVRWRPDGNIEFLGRLDSQVKVRGFRVELGEIECALRETPGVRDAAVVVRDDEATGKSLAAYVVTDEGSGLDEGGLNAALKMRLPTYMIPADIAFLGSLPLTPSGKLDRRALPAPRSKDTDDSRRSAAFPRTLVELDLARIWERLFQREGIGRDDNFFDIGGHSLLAARLVSEIEGRFGRRISIASLFQSPTIASLARMLGDEAWSPAWTSLVPMQPMGSGPPVFCVHGWRGEVYTFLDLARELAPARKVFGVQAVGLDGRGPLHKSVEEMAAHYAREIRSLETEGPYHLVGYSLGGWIAYAVAQELVRQGGKVGLLALIDTRATCDLPLTFRAREHLPYLLKRIAVHVDELKSMPVSRRLSYLGERWKTVRLQLDSARRVHSAHRAGATAPPVRGIDPENDYYYAASLRYRPASYAGDLDLFVGDDVVGKGDSLWKRLVQGRVRVRRVPGEHLTLTNHENIKDFASIFKQALREAEARARVWNA